MSQWKIYSEIQMLWWTPAYLQDFHNAYISDDVKTDLLMEWETFDWLPIECRGVSDPLNISPPMEGRVSAPDELYDQLMTNPFKFSSLKFYPIVPFFEVLLKVLL